ncbi:MAG: hypothetical protein M1840_007900 [Geoglossum simile]|nr:MAG: hypothetical protein M1840_007900 [Geoglossum simile]
MAIQRLPEPAVRAIGSCQALTESSSIVKELIDNALDATATSVAVEISANALDVLQVKDNGHGIAPEDRGIMAVRYSTSKISCLRELESLGGRSLGFRGVALSAACQMAGRMVITTRTEGESVAEACWIGKSGSIESRECASHPVGTTVRILDFLKCIPVRRGNALKKSAKTLARIQRTLQAYAFARPNVRFSLKVLKSGKGNWLYAPRKNPTHQLDLSLIIGKDAAGQCIRRSYPLLVQDDGEASRGNCRDAYSIEAFIPGLDADISKISGKGQFISIDSRPVSCSRGTLKQISSLYKNYLRSASQGCAAGKLVDPFICMNIVCPLGSYDVNVEPAKDDVQFGDPGVVLSVVENFFQGLYGELKPQALERQTPGPGGKGGGFYDLLGRKNHQTAQNEDTIVRNRHGETTDDDGLDEILMGGPNDSITTMDNPQALELLLSPLSTPLHSSDIRIPAADHLEARLENPSEIDSSTIQSAWKFTMYGHSDEEDEEIAFGGDAGGVLLTEVREMEENVKAAALDPWTIAKMNSPARGGPPTGYSSELGGPNAQLPSPKRSPQRTPLKSSNFRRPSRQEGLDRKTTYVADVYPSPRSPRITPSPSTSRKFTAVNRGSRLLGAGILDTWLRGPHRQSMIPTYRAPPETIQVADALNTRGVSSIQRRQRPRCKPGSFAPTTILPPNTPLKSDSNGFIKKTGPLEPVRTAVPTPSGMSELPDCRRWRSETVKQTQETSEAAATKRDTCPTPSPHSNRYQAARAALASASASLPSPESEDLIRLAQPDLNSVTMLPRSQDERTKAIILPLEMAPAVFHVHNLSTVVRTTVESVERVERAVALSDAYVACGKASYAFPSDLRGASEIESSLRALTCGMCQNEAGEIVNLNTDLSMLMRGDLCA